MNRKHRFHRAAFLLLETMIGVAVFALGVLALARCAGNCIDAETERSWDERARTALENRMAEIEAGAVKLDADREDKLSGRFKGITLRLTRSPVRLKNDESKAIPGLCQVHLEALWGPAQAIRKKRLTFYANLQK